MNDGSGNGTKRPGILKRILSVNRRLRRLDGQPLLQDMIGGRHAVSYIRHLARGNEIQRKQFFCWYESIRQSFSATSL